ncbi:MAG: hypothetical protein ACP5O4_05985 [bacterium]
MSLTGSFVPFNANNLDLSVAEVYVRLWDKNNNTFYPTWLNLGFVKEGVSIDLPKENVEAFAGIPQALIARVISKVNATAKFSLYEVGDIRLIALAFGQQPVNITTSGTTTRTETYSNPNLTSLFTTDPLNNIRRKVLNYQAVDLSSVVVEIKDSSSPVNTYNVSNQFIFSTIGGLSSVIPKNQVNIIDTSGLSGFTGPISELKFTYNQLNLQRQDTGYIRDLVLANSPVRLLIIGRNLAPGSGELIAVRFSKALIGVSGSMNIAKPEFNVLEVEVAGLIDYPQGQGPVSSNIGTEILGYYKYPGNATISDILGDLM